MGQTAPEQYRSLLHDTGKGLPPQKHLSISFLHQPHLQDFHSITQPQSFPLTHILKIYSKPGRRNGSVPLEPARSFPERPLRLRELEHGAARRFARADVREDLLKSRIKYGDGLDSAVVLPGEKEEV